MPSQNKKQTILYAALLITAITAPTCQTHAFSEDKNWPCIQRKVSTLSAGQMWRGEPFDTKDESWKSNKAVTDLVAKILPRRVPLTETEKHLQTFAANHKPTPEKPLQGVFLALLSETNQIRSEIIRGINRFAKRQKALTTRITANRQKRDALEKKDQAGTLTKQEDKDLQQLDQALEWDKRIYEEREQSLEYVCEAPVILEQRLFALSKQIAQVLTENKKTTP